jgi:hypothetical protein
MNQNPKSFHIKQIENMSSPISSLNTGKRTNYVTNINRTEQILQQIISMHCQSHKSTRQLNLDISGAHH